MHARKRSTRASCIHVCMCETKRMCTFGIHVCMYENEVLAHWVFIYACTETKYSRRTKMSESSLHVCACVQIYTMLTHVEHSDERCRQAAFQAWRSKHTETLPWHLGRVNTGICTSSIHACMYEHRSRCVRRVFMCAWTKTKD